MKNILINSLKILIFILSMIWMAIISLFHFVGNCLKAIGFLLDFSAELAFNRLLSDCYPTKDFAFAVKMLTTTLKNLGTKNNEDKRVEHR